MTQNLAVPFDQRSGGATIPFSGLPQNGQEDCVYGIIGGAVNHLAAFAVWATAKQLADECDRLKKSSPTFDVVSPVAVVPVKDRVAFDIPRDRIQNDESTYRRLISDCVTSGGVAVVSLEGFPTQYCSHPGIGWHMLTLIHKSGSCYQVLDTNSRSGFVDESELITRLFYAKDVTINGIFYPEVWMHRHDKLDCILLNRKP